MKVIHEFRSDVCSELGEVRSGIAGLRGELRALRRTMAAVGVGQATLNLALEFLG